MKMKTMHYFLLSLISLSFLTLAQIAFAVSEDQIERTEYGLKVINQSKTPVEIFMYSSDVSHHTDYRLVPANGGIFTDTYTLGSTGANEKSIGIGFSKIGIFELDLAKNFNQSRFTTDQRFNNKCFTVQNLKPSAGEFPTFKLQVCVTTEDTELSSGKYKRTYIFTLSNLKQISTTQAEKSI